MAYESGDRENCQEVLLDVLEHVVVVFNSLSWHNDCQSLKNTTLWLS